MQSSNPQQHKPKTLVIAIHGVGDPEVDEIARALDVNLNAGHMNFEVHEINWNQITDKPKSEKGNIRLTAISTLAEVIARTSLSCPTALKGAHSHSLLRPIFRLQQGLFLFADAALAVAWWAILLFPPSAFLGALASSMFITNTSVISDRLKVFIVSMSAPAIRIALICIALFMGISFLQSLYIRSVSPAWIALRRAVTLLVRPILFVVTLPFLLPWRGLASSIWEARREFTVMVLFCLGFIVGMFRLVLPSEEWRSFLASLHHFGMKAIEAVALAIGAAVLVGAVLLPVLKILLDIFRYAGDPTYRRRIQDLAVKRVKEARIGNAAGEVYIVAHSLGTVVAVDALLNSKSFAPSDRITLITMGSPLRRFFFRFFPDLFFPAKASNCANALISRYAGFRWINCYRPWDQIGTRLSLPEHPWISEVCTQQWRKIISAHPGYWMDSRVRDIVVDKCRTMTFSDGGTYKTVPTSFEVGFAGRSIVMKALWHVLVGAMMIAPLLGIVIGAKMYRAGLLHERSARRMLQSKGIETDAIVQYERRPVAYDEQGFPDAYETLLTLSYEDRKQTDHKLVLEEYEIFSSLSDPSLHVANFWALKQFVMDSQKKSTNIPVKVRIKYLSEEPETIYVTQFPPNPIWLNWLWVGICTLLGLALIVVFTLAAMGVTYFAGGTISEWYVGQRLFQESWYN